MCTGIAWRRGGDTHGVEVLKPGVARTSSSFLSNSGDIIQILAPPSMDNKKENLCGWGKAERGLSTALCKGVNFIRASILHRCKKQEVEELADSFAEGNFVASAFEATAC